jgi:hypothetical protein
MSSNVEMVRALVAFQRSAVDLLTVWENYHDNALAGYPQGWGSFDEMVADLGWFVSESVSKIEGVK